MKFKIVLLNLLVLDLAVVSLATAFTDKYGNISGFNKKVPDMPAGQTADVKAENTLTSIMVTRQEFNNMFNNGSLGMYSDYTNISLDKDASAEPFRFEKFSDKDTDYMKDFDIRYDYSSPVSEKYATCDTVLQAALNYLGAGSDNYISSGVAVGRIDNVMNYLVTVTLSSGSTYRVLVNESGVPYASAEGGDDFDGTDKE